MSALTSPLPTAPGRPAALARDLRWLLRLHRPTLYVWAALVVVLAAALLWLAGPLTDASADAWRDYDACRDGGAVPTTRTRSCATRTCTATRRSR